MTTTIRDARWTVGNDYDGIPQFTAEMSATVIALADRSDARLAALAAALVAFLVWGAWSLVLWLT